MRSLLYHTMSPNARLARLLLEEYGCDYILEEINPWARTPDFLEINPAATLPVLVLDDGMVLTDLSAVIFYIEETYGQAQVTRLMPDDAAERAETRRLWDWVTAKFAPEVTNYLIDEKVKKRLIGQGAPDPAVLRAAKTNLTNHIGYFAYLFATRNWVAGNQITLADLALAAHVSCLDYLGDIDWATQQIAHQSEFKDWYARMKSRPSFRPILAERLVGTPASAHYANLDF